MNKPNEHSNIVELGQRGGNDPRSERVGELLAAVRGIAAKRLQGFAGSMFENVDDALFDLAEKAENNAVQTQYFDGMREVRKKRTLIERVFQEQIARGFAALASGRVAEPREATHPVAGGPAELSLVEDSELEESLAITSMVGKAEGRLSRALYAVNQRLSVICGGSRVENAANPIGPSQLGQAFRQAMRELAVEMRVKLIVYKLFDRYVMGSLDALYEEINGELVRAGVLPQLRHEVAGRRTPGARRAPATEPGETTAGESGGGTDEAYDERDALRAEIVQTLHALLASRRSSSGGGGGGSASGVPSLSPAELLGALALLQGEAARDTTSLPGDRSLDTPVSADDVRLLKEQLVKQIGRLRGDGHGRVSGADEDTIDLVSMLFEFILQDRNLPVDMQVLLARLQIPYLRAAILDRRMFAHASHPARKLLDALAEAAKGWSPESDRDQRLLGKVRSIVETLLQEFDDDIGVFARLLTEFQEFQDGSRRRAELAEQRAAEATRGREKLQQARRRAAQEILQRVEGRDLPPLVHGILTRAWANYLVLTLLRQGEDSQEFRVGLRFVDDFVWSTGPMRSEAERERLGKLLPLLEKSLRHGLATVAFQDADVESLMGQLHALYSGKLGRPAPEGAVQAPATADSEPAQLPIPDSVETIATPEAIRDEEEAPSVELAEDDPHLQRARELKAGTWLEFQTAEGQAERAKLSWISPISGKYLFVNRRGLKVADKTVHQLAAEFAAGTALVLEELPLFDRALDAIVERLRRTQQQAPAETSQQPAGESPASATPSSDT